MATKYNKSMRLPTDNYVVRIVEETFGPSKSSGNPMITLKGEVQSPDEVDIAGEKVTVAGLKVTHYLTTKVMDGDSVNLEKTQNCAKRLCGGETSKGMYQLFGIPMDAADFNPDNPTLGFKGKLVHVRLGVDEQPARKDPTAEQAKNGQLGDVIVNPVTKQPVVYYSVKIAEVYGLAAESGM